MSPYKKSIWTRRRRGQKGGVSRQATGGGAASDVSPFPSYPPAPGPVYSVLEMRGFQDKLELEYGFVLEKRRFQDEWQGKKNSVLIFGYFQDGIVFVVDSRDWPDPT